MSGRISATFVDFTTFSFQFDVVRWRGCFRCETGAAGPCDPRRQKFSQNLRSLKVSLGGWRLNYRARAAIEAGKRCCASGIDAHNDPTCISEIVNPNARALLQGSGATMPMSRNACLEEIFEEQEHDRADPRRSGYRLANPGLLRIEAASV
jgi:hypothetical protein